MSRRIAVLLLVFILAAGMFSGCGNKPQEEPAGDPVTLTIAGSWTECRAIEEIGRLFKEKYSNCTVVYESLQDYYPSVEKRMTGEDTIDLFFTNNIQEGSAMLPYALDLNSCEDLDLSGTFGGLIENFTFREKGADSAKIYAVPVGAEMRGLYVNKTLLEEYNLSVPTDQESLLEACRVLKDNGYIPFHGNPGDFAQTLIYPWICNLIANADNPQEAFDKVNTHEAGVSEMFAEPYEFLYGLVENYYYDYKTAQGDGLFLETIDEAYARDFFNVVKNGDNYEKSDDIGRVAFLPSPMSMQNVIEKTKEDYHSSIEYVFIPAPVSENGGFAYMSPAHGIAANKDSANAEWAVKFLDFMFRPENNEIFAKAFNVIPNTKEAFDYISSLYDIPEENISELGQVTFSYDFYGVMAESLTETSKANNPKYMKVGDDGKTSLYPLDYYMDKLEESLSAV